MGQAWTVGSSGATVWSAWLWARAGSIGSRSMWQIGHSPGSAAVICGCIGHW